MPVETVVLMKAAGQQPGSLLPKVFRGFQGLGAILVRQEQLISISCTNASHHVKHDSMIVLTRCIWYHWAVIVISQIAATNETPSHPLNLMLLTLFTVAILIP